MSKESVIKEEKTVQHKPTVDSFVVAPQKQHEKRLHVFESRDMVLKVFGCVLFLFPDLVFTKFQELAKSCSFSKCTPSLS